MEPVVLRVFGLNTEVIIERERELKARTLGGHRKLCSPLTSPGLLAQVLLQLNAAGFGAPVLATFTNGRVEGWLHARPLEPVEMTDAERSPRLARLVAAFHAARVDEPREPHLWPLVRGWLETARTLVLPDPAKQAKLALIDLSSLAAEIEEVQAACDSLRSPTVFCHNDLLAPNFLEEAGGALHLIDFEYSAYGPRGFDLGNHFNEWAGFDCVYSRYPTDEQQRRFLASYLAASSSGGGAVDETALAALVVEADVYSLASHLYWCVWCLIQARYSAVDFDYLTYHEERMQEYWRRKAGVLARLH